MRNLTVFKVTCRFSNEANYYSWNDDDATIEDVLMQASIDFDCCEDDLNITEKELFLFD